MMQNMQGGYSLSDRAYSQPRAFFKFSSDLS